MIHSQSIFGQACDQLKLLKLKVALAQQDEMAATQRLHDLEQKTVEAKKERESVQIVLRRAPEYQVCMCGMCVRMYLCVRDVRACTCVYICSCVCMYVRVRM
jgi:hypothetical protein